VFIHLQKEEFRVSEFEMKYEFKEMLIENKVNRPGRKRKKTLFGVAHDTGNLNSTAANNARYLNRLMKVVKGKNLEQDGRPFRVASAHIFVDDKEIIVTIPMDEVAWHVLYNVGTDNKMYGDDANDAAVGVELCFFTDLNRSKEAYKKYVWVFAYLAHRYKWKDIKKQITFHSVLDPGRKSDPNTAFKQIGVTYDSFLEDVKKEIIACTNKKQKKEQGLTKEEGLALIELCQVEWGKGIEKEKWHTIANKLRKQIGIKE
jgi:N-acetylmuramoyl-L-alanine amidase